MYMLGPIIHNKEFLEEVKARGALVVASLDEAVPPGALVIRAHGAGPEVYRTAAEKGLELVDATCPYVKKIHQYVDGMGNKGYNIIVVGDARHPEVEGIRGWAHGRAVVVSCTEDAAAVTVPDMQKISVVAQTTITDECWNKVRKTLQDRFGSRVEFHKTICRATSERQTEALEIASKVDIMLIIGDKSSANTQKLCETCRTVCPGVISLESAKDLPEDLSLGNASIGITAGASTPGRVVREVLGRMDEMARKDNEMDFGEALKQHDEENNNRRLGRGATVRGKVLAIKDNEISIGLGFKYDGLIKRSEFSDAASMDPNSSLKVGDEIEVFVIRVNEKDSVVELSQKRVENSQNYTELLSLKESGEPIEVMVTGIVNGGVLAGYQGIRIFIPASQLSERYVKELDPFKGQKLKVRITECNPEKRKVVASAKSVILEEKKKRFEEFWGSVSVGMQMEGTVRSIADFGAFVDLGGFDGLIHVSELSWNRIKHPSEVLKAGDTVEVQILELDKERGRISLGFRKPEENPWYGIEERIHPGDVLKGEVVRIVPFGAFISLMEGVDGLVHISRISTYRIAKVEEVLHIGQQVDVKVLEVNGESRKISLSIRDVEPINPIRNPDATAAEQEGQPGDIPAENRDELTSTIGELTGNESAQPEEPSNEE
ncbi:MAG TPA: 4-hydroxy-3-methylbut-2-enyl diphosphate reductase [Clostridiales bacterium]|nr:4-hydroxy-3-methylbut-2-enyl diphosphate reductase [Clostridiales bacterium]